MIDQMPVLRATVAQREQGYCLRAVYDMSVFLASIQFWFSCLSMHEYASL